MYKLVFAQKLTSDYSLIIFKDNIKVIEIPLQMDREESLKQIQQIKEAFLNAEVEEKS